MERHFLAQDAYGNWYCLPESLRETWDRLITRDDSSNYDAWDIITEHKTDLLSLTFENPLLPS